jgi:MoaA/NifB/PqqE/SkfB family radical SAM enzyme
MPEISLMNQILSAKAPDQSEIELHLFEFCNLKCYFCGQNHDDKTGMNLIADKIKPIQEFIQNNHKNKHIINIMGGEIFNDKIQDSLFDEYFNLACEVDRFAKSIGHSCHFNWVTNLVYTKHQRVRDFLNKLRAEGITTKLSTSYDFTGRKNKTWISELFQKNIELFREDIYTVGFVLTKPAIEFMLTQKDEYFEYLYQHYPLYFDFYVPEAGANVLMPSDDEILEAYRFVAKNFPQVSPVKELLENDMNKMTCYSLNKLTLLPDNREVKCRYLNYKDGDFKNPVDYKSNDNIILSFVEENQCLSCEWYNKCGFRCFVQADWAKRKSSSTCMFKTFFNEHAN